MSMETKGSRSSLASQLSTDNQLQTRRRETLPQKMAESNQGQITGRDLDWHTEQHMEQVHHSMKNKGGRKEGRKERGRKE